MSKKYNKQEEVEHLINFLLHLHEKELINNHDFDYEKEARKYLKKKLKKNGTKARLEKNIIKVLIV